MSFVSQDKKELLNLLHQINNRLFIVSGKIEILLRQKKLFRNINSDLKMLAEQIEEIKKVVDILFQAISKESNSKSQ
jgi:cob(I)alamin adenosyltransferase